MATQRESSLSVVHGWGAVSSTMLQRHGVRNRWAGSVAPRGGNKAWNRSALEINLPFVNFRCPNSDIEVLGEDRLTTKEAVKNNTSTVCSRI